MSELNSRIEELRQQALAKVRSEEFDDALAMYDEALTLATDEEVRELITINKGHALIAAERTGPEVKALPMILMRRRNAHHTFLSAYALMYTHRLTNESKRAIFYGQIALEAATQAEQTFWKLAGGIPERTPLNALHRELGARLRGIVELVSVGDLVVRVGGEPGDLHRPTV